MNNANITIRWMFLYLLHWAHVAHYFPIPDLLAVDFANTHLFIMCCIYMIHIWTIFSSTMFTQSLSSNPCSFLRRKPVRWGLSVCQRGITSQAHPEALITMKSLYETHKRPSPAANTLKYHFIVELKRKMNWQAPTYDNKKCLCSHNAPLKTNNFNLCPPPPPPHPSNSLSAHSTWVRL